MMRVIKIEDGGKERNAIFLERVPDTEEVLELASILAGTSDLSPEVLSPVYPGSIGISGWGL